MYIYSIILIQKLFVNTTCLQTYFVELYIVLFKNSVIADLRVYTKCATICFLPPPHFLTPKILEKNLEQNLLARKKQIGVLKTESQSTTRLNTYVSFNSGGHHRSKFVHNIL